MKKSLGFTLIELLVTMSIVATLVTLTAPSIAGLVQSGNVASTVNTFLADLRFSRNEAVRRNSSVVMCPRQALESGSLQCASPSPVAADWTSGWLVFENRDADKASYNSETDKLLLVQAPPATVQGIESQVDRIEFNAIGRQQGVAASVTFGTHTPKARQRLVCVGATGRARLAGDGNTSCS